MTKSGREGNVHKKMTTREGEREPQVSPEGGIDQWPPELALAH